MRKRLALGGLLVLLGALAGSGQEAEKPGRAPPRVDSQGDALPDGVLVRIGSSRFRHGGFVRGIAFSPDGKYLVSAGYGDIRVWDAATGKLRHRLKSLADWNHYNLAIGFSTDGRTLTCIGGTKTLHCRLFDLEKGAELRRIDLKETLTSATMAVSPDAQQIALVHVGQDESSLALYEADTGKEKLRIPLPAKYARQLAFSADGQWIVAPDLTDTVRVFDTRTGKPVYELKREGDQVTFAVISPDRRWLFSISQDDNRREASGASIWDLSTGKERHRLAEPASAFYSIICASFSPDGKTLAAGSQYREIVFWEPASGKETGRLKAVMPVGSLAFSPDGKTLASGSNEGPIALWNLATGQRHRANDDLLLPVWNLGFNEDGRRLRGLSETVVVWDPGTGREVHRYANVRQTVGWIALSESQSLLAVRGPEGSINLHDAATGRLVRALKGHKGGILYLLFSADGKRLISGGFDKTVRVWDVLTGNERFSLIGHEDYVGPLALTPDGRWLASTCVNGSYPIRLWDLTTGREVRRFAPRRAALDLAFSHDGRLLASGGGQSGRPNDHGDVQVWEVATGKEFRTLEGHKERVACVAFSPDGRTLATGSVDFTIRLWELSTGKQRRQLNGHEGTIHSIAFSPDGKRLAASSSDAPVYVWDVAGVLEAKKLSTKEVDKAWADLASEDAPAAFQAMRRLAGDPERSVRVLRERLQPVKPVDAKELEGLVWQLDSPRFAERHKAGQELEKRADAAADELRAALKKTTSAETRKTLEEILDRLDTPTPEVLRGIRAVEALEWMATPEAVGLLETLAKGASSAQLTREAAAALERQRQVRR